MTLVTQLGQLCRFATEAAAAPDDRAEALGVVRRALEASEVTLVYGGESGFQHLGDDAELSDTALWLINRDLTTRGNPCGFAVHGGRVADFVTLRPGAGVERAASLLPVRGGSGEMLIVRGPWPEGPTAEQLDFLWGARPALALLLEQHLDIARGQQEQQQLSAFVDISRAILQADDLETMLTRIAHMIARVARIDYVSIDILAEDGAVGMRCLNFRQPNAQVLANRWKRGLVRPDPVREEVLTTGRPMLFADAQNDERIPESGRGYFMRTLIRSTAVLPLAAKDTSLGVISFASHRPLTFVDELPLLEGLASQVAAAVQGVRLHEERQRAQEAVRQSEASLVEAQRIAHIGNWDWNIVTNALHWSDEIYRIFGLTPREFGATYDAFLAAVHPEDRELVQAGVDAALNERKHYSIEHRVVQPGGAVRTVHERGEVVFDADGRPVRMIGTVQDITERREAEAALRQSEVYSRSLADLLQATLESTADGILVVGEDGRTSYFNQRFAWMWQIPSELLEMRDDERLIEYVLDQLEEPAAFRARVAALYGTADESLDTLTFKDGRVFERYSRPLIDQEGVRGRVWSFRDVTAERRAEAALRQSEERFRSLVQHASDLITVVDSETTILYQSPSIERLLGYQADALVGTRLAALLHPEDVPRMLAFVGQMPGRRAKPASVESRLRHCAGGWHAVEIVGTDQRQDPAVRGFVLNIRDVSERKALETQLTHQAYHDPLTTLVNRTRFTDRLEQGLRRAGRNRSLLAVLFMDLDNFKSVNDGLGHAAGDRMLVEIAKRIQTCLRANDTAARFGGDEFAILAEDLKDAADAQALAERIFETLEPPFEINGRELLVRASIGIALNDGGDEDVGRLMRNADVAMYVAKGRGKGRCEVYQASMETSILERLELLGALQHAVERREFVVHYQPIARLDSGRIVGVEALVRWRHPRRGLLPPAQFIPLAEESGVILPLGRWVLREACAQMQRWHALHPTDPPLTIGVNVSVRQMQEPGFVEEVADAITKSGLSAAHLVLEITESVMLQDADAMVSVLQQLKQIGVQLAIDDFGTGYSSLNYLRQFPFDVLKIDKAFVEHEQHVDHKDLARAIIELGRTLHMEIVAEGIETAEQAGRLHALGCQVGQGFYFARPLPAHQAERLIRDSLGRRAA